MPTIIVIVIRMVGTLRLAHPTRKLDRARPAVDRRVRLDRCRLLHLRQHAAVEYLTDHFHEAPVLLVPCSQERAMPAREALPPPLDATYERELAYERRIHGGSIYPAVQNVILACRAFGLGTLITTNHIRCEDEVKALLGLPADVSTYALMPIGYPQGKFGPLTRKPVSEVAYADRWGVAWPS